MGFYHDTTQYFVLFWQPWPGRSCNDRHGRSACCFQPGHHPLRLSDAEWQKRLDPAQYAVLRKEGTERPGSSALNAEKRVGVFHCAGCELPLFSSSSKYESGTGWPSFSSSLPGAVQTRTDYKLIFPRTEYHCARCEGHQGHVFNDGPQPTGKRFCNNGVALKFAGAV